MVESKHAREVLSDWKKIEYPFEIPLLSVSTIQLWALWVQKLCLFCCAPVYLWHTVWDSVPSKYSVNIQWFNDVWLCWNGYLRWQLYSLPVFHNPCFSDILFIHSFIHSLHSSIPLFGELCAFCRSWADQLIQVAPPGHDLTCSSTSCWCFSWVSIVDVIVI